MASKRSSRVNEQVKREIAEILRSEVKDPRVGMVIVTATKVAPDLANAQVFVAITGDDDEKKETLAGLNAAAPFIRSQLSQRMSVRKVPMLRFIRDDSIEYGTRIEQLLSQVRETDAPRSENEQADEDDGRAD